MHPDGAPETAWYDDAAGPVVRPYVMTGGRFAPDQRRLDLVCLVVAHGDVPPDAQLLPEQAQIVRNCRRPLSVAELGADLDLPVDTVRVLLGDLLEAGLIELREPPTLSGRPSRELLEALLAGLRTL
ncbi:DUF742 domain-containing protein [Micromonospora phytophila]|uniref:DUF742 domain-containing protein n=1 Tax=Micromonospora phytophila TaxID=709888 RepID=UPI00202F4043|nr:DUF742 domain-containing protein [Micromonospora phytophila]MCM0676043.1 DUF742 domain-containing protein [Micromonospora phytophila]